ncbi:MAG: Gfo/Idh/MocA family oxidoreductase [Chloroflexi bacterium]|nr:Gfo/Idh/MocA family oxidoreductase [Chloroflexota bacterium]
MTGKLRVAIIGAGMIANAGHIPAWKSLQDDVELVGVANPTVKRAHDTAARHGIPRAYGDWRKMLSELQPDVVSVCTPNAAHREATIAALEAGAHVFCEKPIATSSAEAEEMYAAAESHNKVLMVTQTARFSSTTIAARELAASGQLGEIYYAETAAMRRRGTPTWGRFHMKEASGGGPIYDLGVHILDSLFWIMGNPRVTAVSAMTYTKLANRDERLVTSLAASGAPVGVYDPRPYDPREFDVEDMAAAFIRLENGATVSFKTSWAANVPDGLGGTLVVGTKAGLKLRPLTVYGAIGNHQADTSPIVPPDPDIPFYGHWLAAEHMVKVIRGEAELLVKKEEVLNVMRALDAMYESARLGREVRLDASV